MKAFWILPLLGLAPCLLVVFQTYSEATSAPQQAVGGIYAVAWVVIPYCVARAITELTKSDPPDQLKQISESLAVSTNLLASIANAAGPAKPPER